MLDADPRGIQEVENLAARRAWWEGASPVYSAWRRASKTSVARASTSLKSFGSGEDCSSCPTERLASPKSRLRDHSGRQRRIGDEPLQLAG